MGESVGRRVCRVDRIGIGIGLDIDGVMTFGGAKTFREHFED